MGLSPAACLSPADRRELRALLQFAWERGVDFTCLARAAGVSGSHLRAARRGIVSLNPRAAALVYRILAWTPPPAAPLVILNRALPGAGAWPQRRRPVRGSVRL